MVAGVLLVLVVANAGVTGWLVSRVRGLGRQVPPRGPEGGE